MSKIVKYSKELVERGSERVEEAAKLKNEGKYEAAKVKTLQAAGDLLTVGKTASIVMEQEIEGLAVDAKILASCLKGIEEISERGKQILREVDYSV